MTDEWFKTTQYLRSSFVLLSYCVGLLGPEESQSVPAVRQSGSIQTAKYRVWQNAPIRVKYSGISGKKLTIATHC